MASDRRSARQAKVVKKEPSFAIASSAMEQAEPDAPEQWIAIDLAQALPGVAITQSMQIIIEGVPDGARFSTGRNNGDKTWSLAPEDLVGLGYMPPPGRGSDDQSFFVRLLTYDPDGYQIASTTAQVAVSVDGVTARRPVRLDRGEGDAAAIDAIREIELAQRLAEAERAWEAAAAERIEQLEQSWHDASEQRLRAAEEEWRQAEADRNRALNDQLADLARRLRDAEMEWQRAESERISAALAQAADFTAQRFAAAEEQWRAEADRRVEEAERAAQQAIAAARADIESQIEGEFEARASALAEEANAQFARQLQQAEAAFEQRLHQERAALAERLESARRESGAEAEARLRSELERSEARHKEIEAALKRLKDEAEAARLSYDRELAERQHAWDMERTALLAASSSSDPATGDRMAALEERWRVEADRVAQQTEARVRREAEQRLAEAEASWSEIAQRRIAEAQREWEESAQLREGELKTAEAERSERTLAAMRARMAEVERLAAEAERRIAERERQLSEAQTTRQRLEADLATSEARIGEEVERRILEARSAWRAVEEERLAEAKQVWATAEASRIAELQARWDAEQDQRLQTAIAAERLMLAGSEVGQMLNQAQARWREAEQERLVAAEARWKMQEDQRIAAAVAAAREDMERMVEARLHRELAVDARRVMARSGGGFSAFWAVLRWSAAGAAAAASAGFLYIAAPEIRALIPESQPIAAEQPEPVQTVAVQPSVPALVVAAEFGNLRSQPSTAAPIVARLERGTPVVATERRSNWVKASDGVTTGWIHSSLLEGPLPTSE
ncbi:MAG TPA: SH3 domain-containing protein [Alphaproteobacteria bacterium]